MKDNETDDKIVNLNKATKAKKAASTSKIPAKSGKRQADGKFSKGCSGNLAGPKVGTKKLKTHLVEQILANHECCPITAMIDLLKDDSTPVQVRGKLASELATFVYPKRKSIEHSGNVGNGKTAEEMTDEELEHIVNS